MAWIRSTGAPAQGEIVALLRGLREAGVEPHPFGGLFPENVDLQVAQTLRVTLTSEEEGPVVGSEGVMVGVDDDREASEEDALPDLQLGLRNPLFLIPDEIGEESRPSTAPVSTYKYGLFWEMMRDMSKAGLGVASHFHAPDLAWYLLAPFRRGHEYTGEDDEDADDLIPMPTELLEQLTEHRFWAFRCFTLFAICCKLYGMRAMPVLFDYGGGARFNVDFDFVINGANYTKSRLLEGMPAHQPGTSIPSGLGWDGWYYLLHGMEEAMASYIPQVRYQKFALNVWCPDSESDYMQECARRKALGVAAFAYAVGQYLDALDDALASIGAEESVTDLVPWLDLGNELNSYWGRDPELPAEDDGGTAEIIYEAGRFSALLAGPIKLFQPSIKMRFTDLHGHTPKFDWESNCRWVKYCIRDGVTEEVQRWKRLFRAFGLAASGVPTPADVWDFYDGDPEGVAVSLTQALLAGDISQSDYAWLGTLVALSDDSVGPGAPFFWPLSGKFQPKKLVDQVGFHFFESLLRTMVGAGEEGDVDPGERYGDELDLGAQIDELHNRVIRPLARQGIDLTWSLTAICFPATYPDSPTEQDSWYPDTSPAYQAGLAARRVCYVRARGDGPEVVLWYTAMAKITSAGDVHGSWGKYTATGIRNDVVLPPDLAAGEVEEAVVDGGRAAGVALGGFSNQRHAWRRPVWYTLRRLSWLWRRTRSARVLLQDDLRRAVVLQLEAYDEALFRDPVADLSLYGSTAMGRTTGGYRYAYIAWMDELAPEDAGEDFTFEISGAGERGYRVLPLVPQVDYSQDSSGVQDVETRYPDFELPEWTEALAVVEIDDDGFGALTVTVSRAGPGNPSPVCVLTDAPQVSGMSRVVSAVDKSQKNSIASQREVEELEPQGVKKDPNDNIEVLGP